MSRSYTRNSVDFPPQNKYDVFISFRGEDTRDSFVSHLYDALCRKKIETYIDYKLKRGDEISPALLRAIEESSISVIIFSEKFASSSWCLDELEHILECKENRGQFVIPVFYRVDPSLVRRQKGSYAVAFDIVEERFKNDLDKLRRWRDALTTAANLSGWDSNLTRPESALVEAIVADVLKKLNLISPIGDYKDLVGIEKRIKKIESLLQIGSPDVRIIGIWGMGGIGKTTLASVIFNQLAFQFEGCCFLANVREESDKRGINQLRNELFSKLLDEENVDMGSTHLIRPNFYMGRLRRKKVFIVLDDVNDAEQLEYLVGDRDWFGFGSKIIITTRDMQVLWNEVDEIYQVEKLNRDEALQLFHLTAFKRNFPKVDCIELSERVVKYAEGIPLALKVLGSIFRHKREENWESELCKLTEVPNAKIQNVLRISYDGLDKIEKRIFLDIACFFKGMRRDHVEKILDACGFFAKIGIDDLIDKSLITTRQFNILWMHDLVQTMGWEIVRSIEEPGKRSRLWVAREIYRVFKYNTGTLAIEGIFLDTSEFSELYLGPTIFKKMHNLRLLKIYQSQRITKCKVHLPQGLEFLPDELRYLHWYGYPLKSLPSNFMPWNLVELNMSYSQLEKLCDGIQHLGNLKHIDLSHSKHLTQISDLSQATNLESINLSDCTSLLQVPSLNYRNIEKLTCLNKSYCKQLCCLREGSYKARTLGIVNLGGCTNLKSFDVLSGNMRYLNLEMTAVEELPSSIWSLESLVSLDISDNNILKNVPLNILNLKSLHSLSLSGCSSLEKFPILPSNIRWLNLSKTTIELVPSSIDSLSHLKVFSLIDCKTLKSLPTSICKLKSLTMLDLYGCSDFEIFPEILEAMEDLETLDLNETAIPKLPKSIENLLGLCHLSMARCKNLECLPNSIYNMKGLEDLFISNCPKLEKLPLPMPDDQQLCHLRYLDLSYCNVLEIPDSIGFLTSLEKLDLRGNLIVGIPTSIKKLSKLTMLKISDCKYIQSLSELPLSLDFLNASGCTSLKTVQSSTNAFTEAYWDSFHDTFGKEFLCYGCLKLDQSSCYNIMTEFQLKVFCATIFSLPKPGEIYEPKHPKVNACFPGNDIPKWFGYESEGSSINIKLPPHWHNNNFLGLALCTVVALGNYHSDYEYLNFYCEFHFKNSCGDRSRDFCWTFPKWENGELKQEKSELIHSWDHVFLWFQHEEDYRFCVDDAVEVSFEFFLRDDKGQFVNSNDCGVKKCGICLFSLQHAEEFGINNIITDQYRLGRSSSIVQIDSHSEELEEIKEELTKAGIVIKELNEVSESSIGIADGEVEEGDDRNRDGGFNGRVGDEFTLNRNRVINSDGEELEEVNNPSKGRIAHYESEIIGFARELEDVDNIGKDNTRTDHQLYELTKDISNLDIDNVQTQQLEDLVQNIMNYFDQSTKDDTL